jgi:hypothetical protein
MLVALLISLTLPTMLSLMHDTTSSIAENRAAEVAEDIALIMEEMSAGGPGNVRIVTIPADLPAGITFGIGGGNGTVECTRITWTANGREGARYLAGMTVVTEGGKVLTISAGDSIRLECPSETRGTVKAVML